MTTLKKMQMPKSQRDERERERKRECARALERERVSNLQYSSREVCFAVVAAAAVVALVACLLAFFVCVLFRFRMHASCMHERKNERTSTTRTNECEMSAKQARNFVISIRLYTFCFLFSSSSSSYTIYLCEMKYIIINTNINNNTNNTNN